MTEDFNPDARPAPSPGDPSAHAEHSLAERLVSELDAIDNEPLAERAVAYAQLHDRLRDHLEGGDVSGSGRG